MYCVLCGDTHPLVGNGGVRGLFGMIWRLGRKSTSARQYGVSVVHFLFSTRAIHFPLQQCLSLALVLGVHLCSPVLPRGGVALDHVPPPTFQLVAVPGHVFVLFVMDRLWYLWTHTVVEQLVRLVAQRTSVFVDAFVLGWNDLVVAGGRPSLHGAAPAVAMAVPALPSVLFHQNSSFVWSDVR